MTLHTRIALTSRVLAILTSVVTATYAPLNPETTPSTKHHQRGAFASCPEHEERRNACPKIERTDYMTRVSEQTGGNSGSLDSIMSHEIAMNHDHDGNLSECIANR